MLTITPARPDEWPAALELALQHVAPGERAARVANALALLAAGELCPDGVWVARDARGLAGVQVVVPLAGGSSLFCLPQVRRGASSPGLVDCLVQAGIAWLRALGAKMAQAIIDPEAMPQALPLLRSGFVHVTSLHYFRHDLVDVPARPAAPALRLEPYRANHPELFQQTLLRTYVGSRDCPELNERRTVAEIITGHQAQGRFRPDRWQLAWCADQPVGIVIATEMFDDLGWDLSYVGIVPEGRQRGVGRALTAWALNAAKTAGAEQMILAVDVRNAPALAMYEQAGFERTATREVLLQFIV